jgi:hypothetical protein
VPKVGRPNLHTVGTPYLDLEDPLPGFSFVSPDFSKLPVAVKSTSWVTRLRSTFKAKTRTQDVPAPAPDTDKTVVHLDSPTVVCGSFVKEKILRASEPPKKAGFSFAGFFKAMFKPKPHRFSAKDNSLDTPTVVCCSIVKEKILWVPGPTKKAGFTFAGLIKSKDRSPDKPTSEAAKNLAQVGVPVKNGNTGGSIQEPARSVISRVMGWFRRHYRVKVTMGQLYRIDLTEC